MKKFIGLLLISLTIAWILIVASQQSFNLVRNKQFFEIQKNSNKNELYILTISNNKNIKLRLLNIKKNKNCNIKINNLEFKGSKSEIWEINCEK